MSTKKVNYAKMENGDSDGEDFLPAIPKKKVSKEYKENVKPVNSQRLSPAEKRFKRDTEAVILISSSNEENGKSPVRNSIRSNASVPSTSWGLTAKRQRKQIQSYNQDQLCSSDEFGGWEESSEESDFSTSSPVFSKRKVNKQKKSDILIETIKLVNSTSDAEVIPLKSKIDSTEFNITAEDFKSETTLTRDGEFYKSVENGSFSAEHESSVSEYQSDNKQSSLVRIPIASDSSSERNCTDAQVNEVSAVVKQASSYVPAKQSPSLVLKSAKSPLKQMPHKAKRPPVTSSHKGPSDVGKKQTAHPPSKSTNKVVVCTTTSISFKSPVISDTRLETVVATSSPRTGLRLGLSRKGAFKPLHPKASVS